MNISRLKKLIEKKRITQKEIAKYIGLSENAFSTALKKGDFKISMLEKICEYINVPVSYFFEEESGTSPNKQITNGNGNVQMNGVNNGSIKLNNAKHEIDKLKAELSGCREQLKLKDEIIELLKNK